MSDDIAHLRRASDIDTRERIARIEERLEIIQEASTYVRDRIDRLDRSAASTGAITGGVAAIGLAIAAEMVRRHLPL